MEVSGPVEMKLSLKARRQSSVHREETRRATTGHQHLDLQRIEIYVPSPTNRTSPGKMFIPILELG